MNNIWIKLTFGAVALVLVLQAASFARGSFADGGALEPPGGPAPGMKSLQEVEPRTPISSLPYTITTSGSYYLTGNLTPLTDVTGISVVPDNVTIDLNGFTLRGYAGGTQAGIDAGGSDGLTVRNGHITDWGYGGIIATFGQKATFEDLTVSNSSYGIVVSGATVVRDVEVSGGSLGIVVFGTDNVVRDSTVTGASVRGIEITGTGTHNRIENNTVNGNGTGVEAFAAPNVIVKNSAAGNATNFAILGGNFAPVQVPPAVTDPWANISY